MIDRYKTIRTFLAYLWIVIFFGVVAAQTRSKMPEITGTDLEGRPVTISWTDRREPHVLLVVADDEKPATRASFVYWIKAVRESPQPLRLVFVDVRRAMKPQDAQRWGMKPQEVIQVSTKLQMTLAMAELPQTLLLAPTGEMLTVYFGAFSEKRARDLRAFLER